MKPVKKPWGSYQILYAEKGFQVKRIEVNPGARLSLQKHEKRSEKWTVVIGHGTATVNNQNVPVSPGSVIDAPWGVLHRMANTGSTPLIFVEVQIGDYLGEDDIIRVEDDYRRA